MVSQKNAFPGVAAVLRTGTYPHPPLSRSGGIHSSRDLLRNRFGYTLIELLIVLVIMGLLAAIMYPVFSRAREMARKSTCASGLRQIGLGVLQYSQDWDEVMPVAMTYESTGGVIQTWRDLVYPYVRHEGVYNCPSDISLLPSYRYKYQTDRRFPGGGFTYGSYWCNSTYSHNNQVNGSPIQGPCVDPNLRGVLRLQKLSAMQDPSRTIWAADSIGASRRIGMTFELSNLLIIDTTTDPKFKGYRYLMNNTGVNNGYIAWHNGMMNILWCDGHVKAWRPEQLAEYSGVGIKRVPRYFTSADD